MTREQQRCNDAACHWMTRGGEEGGIAGRRRGPDRQRCDKAAVKYRIGRRLEQMQKSA